MGKDKAYVVQSCEVCDVENTTLNVQAKELEPLPVEGLYYRWGVDVAGPFNPTSNSDNRYVFVAIEQFFERIATWWPYLINLLPRLPLPH